MFTFAASVALYDCVTTLFHLLPLSDRYKSVTELWFYCSYFGFYPRDGMLARVIVIATCPSVRLSVRVSVTRRYRVKTKKASGMISSPSGSPKTLVF